MNTLVTWNSLLYATSENTHGVELDPVARHKYARRCSFCFVEMESLQMRCRCCGTAKVSRDIEQRLPPVTRNVYPHALLEVYMSMGNTSLFDVYAHLRREVHVNELLMHDAWDDFTWCQVAALLVSSAELTLRGVRILV